MLSFKFVLNVINSYSFPLIQTEIYALTYPNFEKKIAITFKKNEYFSKEENEVILLV